jgi:hypothetical protein
MSEARLSAPIGGWRFPVLKCRACGCLWLNTLDDFVSLLDGNQKSCEVCERLTTTETCEITWFRVALDVDLLATRTALERMTRERDEALAARDELAIAIRPDGGLSADWSVPQLRTLAFAHREDSETMDETVSGTDTYGDDSDPDKARLLRAEKLAQLEKQLAEARTAQASSIPDTMLRQKVRSCIEIAAHFLPPAPKA